MSVIGAFLDKLIMLAAGIYYIYLSRSKNEKVRDKAKLFKYLGIGLVIFSILLASLDLLKR